MSAVPSRPDPALVGDTCSVSSIDWERVARSHLNATRVLVLEAVAAAADPVSPAELAERLNRPTNEVAYHVSALARKGLVVVHSTVPGRGARKTLYVLA